MQYLFQTCLHKTSSEDMLKLSTSFLFWAPFNRMSYVTKKALQVSFIL